ncbi:Ribosomal large subunit pseudouridine synthase E [hydrothermal vent metagenome]|uniref:Ribosomal large subunit pseudouridine synthase E n=1 Tax=hydrothermal vent metagenome TaxID=652676 RepID=A0A3B0X6E7_9ZZZZ
MAQIVLFNKPYGVICQFSAHEKHPSLAEYITIKDIYPAGRLDHDSEGLLLLTDNGALQHKITDPKNKMLKTYWVQVDKQITEQAIAQLQKGVMLKDGLTKPAKARIISEPEGLWPRDPPIRYRKDIPTSWLELSIREGRNRQVRRMTAAVGFPTLRLVRYKIGEWTLQGVPPGGFVVSDITQKK